MANCSANKARKLVGYSTKFSLEDGIASMIDYIRKRGVKDFKYHIDLEIINSKTPKTWSNKLF